MAVPKKRTGHSAQGKRRANWKATKPEVATCPNCGQPVKSHTVCTACGQYKGKVVSRKDPNFVEEIKEKEVKKAAPKKKASTKKAKVEEKVTEAEPEVKEEETKAEEPAKEEEKTEE